MNHVSNSSQPCSIALPPRGVMLENRRKYAGNEAKKRETCLLTKGPTQFGEYEK